MKPLFRISQDYDCVRLSARRPVRLSDVGQGDYAPHDHEFAELVVVRDGTALHRTADGVRPLRRGSVVVIMPGQVHAFEKTRNLLTTNIYYLSEWLVQNTLLFADASAGAIVPLFLAHALYGQPAYRGVAQFDLATRELRAVRRDMLELMAEIDRPAPSLFFLRATFLRILYRFAAAFERTEGELAGAQPADVARLLASVEVALAQRREFVVALAVRDAGLSPRHASRRFSACVGMSLARYYQRRRIHLACNLLLDSRRSVTEVAHELNFADGPHFSRAFLTERGMTPREYRQVFVSEGDKRRKVIS